MLKMLLSTLTNIVLGQKSEVTAQPRERRQVGLMDMGFSGAHLPAEGRVVQEDSIPFGMYLVQCSQ